MTNENFSFLKPNKENIIIPDTGLSAEFFDELLDRMYQVLETYSNVHRGSGFHSTVTTHLYEKTREIVLEYLGLGRSHQ